MSKKVAQIVSKELIADLERAIQNGETVAPWQKPFKGYGKDRMPLSANTGKPYNGINWLLLSFKAHSMGYNSPYWFTYNQAKNSGGEISIRYEEMKKSTLVVFFKKLENVKRNDDGTAEVEEIWLQRFTQVWNGDQLSKIPDRFKVEFEDNGTEPLKEAEAIFDNWQNKCQFETGGSTAYYMPAKDTIRMPDAKWFKKAEVYAGVKFHEMIHATGANSRLNRKLTSFEMQPESYSKEELIAEIGSAMLCGYIGIHEATKENSKAYLGGWLKHLKNDPQMLFAAASAADKAMQHILNEK